jgi:hypothetical protein
VALFKPIRWQTAGQLWFQFHFVRGRDMSAPLGSSVTEDQETNQCSRNKEHRRGKKFSAEHKQEGAGQH